MLKIVKINKIIASGNAGFISVFCLKNAKNKVNEFERLGLKTKVKAFYLPLFVCKFLRWANEKINYLKFGNYGKNYQARGFAGWI